MKKKPTAQINGANIVVSESGQSILELAVAVPFMLLLLAGSIDFGRYMYDGILIENAAKAGAQYGAQSPQQAAETPDPVTGATGMTRAAVADAQALGVNATSQSCSCGPSFPQTCSSPTPASPAPVATAPPITCPTDYVGTFVQVRVSNSTAFSPFINIGISIPTISRAATAQVAP